MNVCCRSKERMKMYFKIGTSTKGFVFFEFIYLVLTYMLYTGMFPACCFRQSTYCYICVYFQLIAFVSEHMWHKALIMWYLMRLEFTLVCTLNLTANKSEFKSHQVPHYQGLVSHMFTDKSNKLETYTCITRMYFDESNKLETYTYKTCM